MAIQLRVRLAHHRTVQLPNPEQLQCLVAVELKINEFRPEYSDKMNFYPSLLNQNVRKAHEQPRIGITIYQRKQRTVAKIARRNVNNRRTAQLSPLGWRRTPTHCRASSAPLSRATKSWRGGYRP